MRPFFANNVSQIIMTGIIAILLGSQRATEFTVFLAW